ncbi:spore coat associated protein CotJA [Desulfovirgula thermocuniculi]|uniref:spore coat associated protein CotJA n=1 Tax=Desulfovirgula thermocuniculi TaxID=348842 RepID=UPI000410487F|nr:spore coat associated protein CotJA [Desulfovirgula thermocuniculi]
MSSPKEAASQETKAGLAQAAVPEAHVAAYYPPVELAQAYVPWQRYGKIYSPGEALEKGTLFPELYSPYPY